jgi:hypothetical protein
MKDRSGLLHPFDEVKSTLMEITGNSGKEVFTGPVMGRYWSNFVNV